MDTITVKIAEDIGSQSAWFMPIIYSIIGGIITLTGKYLIDLRKHKQNINLLKVEHRSFINRKRIEAYEILYKRYDRFLRKMIEENYSKETLKEFSKENPAWDIYCSNDIRKKESALLKLLSKYALPSNKGKYIAPLYQVLWQFTYCIRQEIYEFNIKKEWYKPIDGKIFQKQIDKVTKEWEEKYFKAE